MEKDNDKKLPINENPEDKVKAPEGKPEDKPMEKPKEDGKAEDKPEEKKPIPEDKEGKADEKKPEDKGTDKPENESEDKPKDDEKKEPANEMKKPEENTSSMKAVLDVVAKLTTQIEVLTAKLDNMNSEPKGNGGEEKGTHKGNSKVKDKSTIDFLNNIYD